MYVSLENEGFFLPNKYFGDSSLSIDLISQELQNMQKQFYKYRTICTKVLKVLSRNNDLLSWRWAEYNVETTLPFLQSQHSP